MSLVTVFSHISEVLVSIYNFHVKFNIIFSHGAGFDSGVSPTENIEACLGERIVN